MPRSKEDSADLAAEREYMERAKVSGERPAQAQAGIAVVRLSLGEWSQEFDAMRPRHRRDYFDNAQSLEARRRSERPRPHWERYPITPHATPAPGLARRLRACAEGQGDRDTACVFAGCASESNTAEKMRADQRGVSSAGWLALVDARTSGSCRRRAAAGFQRLRVVEVIPAVARAAMASNSWLHLRANSRTTAIPA